MRQERVGRLCATGVAVLLSMEAEAAGGPAAAPPPEPAAAIVGEGLPSPAPAPEDDDRPLAVELGGGFVLTPNAQYLLRYRYHQGHDFAEGGDSHTLRHRARLGADLTYDGVVGLFVQVQDVRLFGEERSTLGDFAADGFDLHQGYAHVRPAEGLRLRLGRQEIAYENHRLIGTVGWLEQARSFDALRLSLERDVVRWDAFYAKVGEDAASTTDEAGDPFHRRDHDLMAANLHVDPIKRLGVGALGVADLDWTVGRKLYTVGLIAEAELPLGIVLGGEGYYQLGEAPGDVRHRAFFAGARAELRLDVPTKPYLKLFGDFASGDADPSDTEVEVFDTLYATNHKFYGEADFFLDLPAHTGGRGLRDTGAQIGFQPLAMLKAHATYHLFGAMAVQADGLDTFGHEIDVGLQLSPWKPFRWDLVYAVVIPEEIFEAAVAGPVPEHFVYSTVDVAF